MTVPIVRQAVPDDLDDVVRIIDERTDWLQARGSDQWSTRREHLRSRMAQRVCNGETVVLVTPGTGRVLATMSTSRTPDPDFWTAAEQRVPALYISRLATAMTGARGAGALLLCWSIVHSGQAGLLDVRLDAWKTATGLHRYYIRNGWTYLRTVDLPHRHSGALFHHVADPHLELNIHSQVDEQDIPERHSRPPVDM